MDEDRIDILLDAICHKTSQDPDRFMAHVLDELQCITDVRVGELESAMVTRGRWRVGEVDVMKLRLERLKELSSQLAIHKKWRES